MDITYHDQGLFTHFYPHTTEGEHVWRRMAEGIGTASVLSIHAKSVVAQIRLAGYKVRKHKPCKKTLDELLAEDEILLKELGL